MTPVAIRLGTMEYRATHALQRAIVERQILGEQPPTLLFVEHPPTITVGRRGSETEVVAPEVVLRRRGVAVEVTDRGGQVTFHGPGQIVVYPHINVETIGLHEYMRRMEQAVIETIGEFAIEGYRVEGRTGVWVGKEKICAMGIRVRRWWTMHGLALNVTTDLNYFGLIIPCGIRDRGVCSMQKLLGNDTPPQAVVEERLRFHLSKQLGHDFRWVAKESLDNLMPQPT